MCTDPVEPAPAPEETAKPAPAPAPADGENGNTCWIAAVGGQQYTSPVKASPQDYPCGTAKPGPSVDETAPVQTDPEPLTGEKQCWMSPVLGYSYHAINPATPQDVPCATKFALDGQKCFVNVQSGYKYISAVPATPQDVVCEDLVKPADPTTPAVDPAKPADPTDEPTKAEEAKKEEAQKAEEAKKAEAKKAEKAEAKGKTLAHSGADLLGLAGAATVLVAGGAVALRRKFA